MQKKIGVGSELDSYCGKCKLLLNHVVVAMVESEPKRVRCLTCQSEHNHRVPKPKSSGSRSRSTSGTKSKTSRSVASAAARWQALLADWDEEAAKAYSIYESFSVNDWLSHPKFGKGGVIEVPGPDRIITLFESGEKMLMQGKRRG